MSHSAPTLQPHTLTSHTGERVIFLGTPAIAVPTLKALAETALRPIAVITEPDKPVGRKQLLTPSPIKVAAQALGIPVSQPATTDELLQVIQSLHPTLGVVVAYGHILKPELLAVPDHGFVNLHFSLLPKYRGATPIQAALLAGDAETGVTLMRIDPGLDTGPVIGYAHETIVPTDTAGTLGERLAELAGPLATTLLPLFITGAAIPTPQDSSDEPVTKKLSKADGRIDWSKSSADLDRFIRAMHPWPGAWTELAGLRIILHRAQLEAGKLRIEQIQVAGHRSISGAEFARGYPQALTALEATGKVSAHF